MKKYVLALVSSTLILSGCASTSGGFGSRYVMAQVVLVQQRDEICEKSTNETGNVVAGAVVGGLLGSAFGKGKGKTAMVATGAIVGGAVANANNQETKDQYRCKSGGYSVTVNYANNTKTIITQQPYQVGEYIQVEW